MSEGAKWFRLNLILFLQIVSPNSSGSPDQPSDTWIMTEAVQNVLTLVWKQYRALVINGRTDAAELIKSILWYAIKQTKDDRMIQGSGKANDTFEQRRRGNGYAENVDLNNLVGHATPVSDQAAFRIDVPLFLDTLSKRQRRMANNLAAGWTTSEVAEMVGITPGAVSQFRTRFKSLFDKFFAVA